MECSRQKENMMDRNFYQTKLAEEHQYEISKELTTRSQLRGAQQEPLTGKQAKVLILRIVPVVIVITVLL
jgi:hypothetical protein